MQPFPAEFKKDMKERSPVNNFIRIAFTVVEIRNFLCRKKSQTKTFTSWDWTEGKLSNFELIEKYSTHRMIRLIERVLDEFLDKVKIDQFLVKSSLPKGQWWWLSW